MDGNTALRLEEFRIIKVMNNRRYLLFKRFFDVTCSLAGIIILSPVFIVLSALIKLDSKGPIFFGHERVGKDGTIFKCWKFRTMVYNADEVFNKFTDEQKEEFLINFKLKDDPRITKIGKILRDTSLDELPQLWNILIGNMSVVGPRPVVVNELKMYGTYKDYLLAVKPGLTGLWQVNGRSDTTYEERVALDMRYISERNLMFDFFIILKTFKKVLKKEGAY